MATQTVTFASMITTDRRATVYGVYRGVLRADDSINLNAETTVDLGHLLEQPRVRFCYRCAEDGFATEGAPPVPWESHAHICGKVA